MKGNDKMYKIKLEKIKKLREAKGLYMKDIGNYVGLSGTQYGKRERGEVSFTAEEFLELPHVFNIELEIFLDYVLERDDESNTSQDFFNIGEQMSLDID